jgi:type II secretory pathway pseudopilin PulG
MKKQQILSQVGRSMVEMLGVLAIIGVLSIGSLASYRAAMKKYDLNRYTQQLEAFFAGICDYIRATKNISRSINEDLIAPAIQANFLPDEMINPSDRTQIVDYYGQVILSTYSPNFNQVYYIQLSAMKQEVCRAVLQFAQRNADSLYHLARFYVSSQPMYGKNSCTDDKVCIADQSFSDLNNWCTTYCPSSCSIQMTFSKDQII